METARLRIEAITRAPTSRRIRRRSSSKVKHRGRNGADFQYSGGCGWRSSTDTHRLDGRFHTVCELGVIQQRRHSGVLFAIVLNFLGMSERLSHEVLPLATPCCRRVDLFPSRPALQQSAQKESTSSLLIESTLNTRRRNLRFKNAQK